MVGETDRLTELRDAAIEADDVLALVFDADQGDWDAQRRESTDPPEFKMSFSLTYEWWQKIDRLRKAIAALKG